jgi:hypothetical protein
MDENFVKALVGVAGAIAGALLAAFANAYAANRRIKEIELTYQQKLRDTYLDNARKMSEGVYLPINLLLTNLTTAYDKFRIRVNFDNRTAPEGSYNNFLGAIRGYLSDIDKLLARGADAYLTVDLDDQLRRFNSFIRESTSADKPIRKLILEMDTSGSLIRLPLPSGRIEHKTKSLSLGRFGISNVSFRLPGMGQFKYKEEILAAPLMTREFEGRMQTDVLSLKALIKEVTLGSGALQK